MDTKSLLNLNSVEPFNAKQLYKKVIAEFDNYKTKLFVIDSLAESSLSRNMESREEQKNGNSDKTFSLVLKREKLLEQVKKFEGKIEYAKSTFTKDEMILFNHSILEREIDKVIMDDMAKYERTYSKIKKSCYAKIALSLGLIHLKDSIENKVQMVAPIYE